MCSEKVYLNFSSNDVIAVSFLHSLPVLIADKWSIVSRCLIFFLVSRLPVSNHSFFFFSTRWALRDGCFHHGATILYITANLIFLWNQIHIVTLLVENLLLKVRTYVKKKLMRQIPHTGKCSYNTLELLPRWRKRIMPALYECSNWASS